MLTTTEEFQRRSDLFHAHIDDCEQCASNPWNMCPTGARLLREAVTPPDPINAPPTTSDR